MKGFTDKPVSTLQDDVFGVSQYIAGLNDFILECNTPMTIAIQGDWGSGKTSMMNMIREQLGDKVVTSWFNTWQYSQFNMDDSLAVSFLSRLITDLDAESDQNNSKMKETVKTIFRFVQRAGMIAVDTMVGGAAAEAVNDATNAVFKQSEMDMPSAISELRTQFEDAVKAKTDKCGKDRLVIFIDDLDRLHPGKAVELLEVLKLFLDCNRCVFVLAIDYAVVSQGVKQKYGELIGEEKGRSFFDKIIQVPFKMPVAQYDVRNYITTSLGSMGIKLLDDEIESYVKLIQNSVGCNPRAMKRLFNAFLLLNKVASKDTISDPAERKMLFAILCLQFSFESIYNYIVSNPSEVQDGKLLKDMATQAAYTEGGVDSLSYVFEMSSDEQIMKAVSFMTVFNDIIDQEEVSKFIHILSFSTITSNTVTQAIAEDSMESHYRYWNRDITKQTIDQVEKQCGVRFKLYQARTNNNDRWKKYYAGAWTHLPCKFGKVGVEFKIATNIQEKISELTIWVYAADKTDHNRFTEEMKDWGNSQTLGFDFLENECGYWLHNTSVDAEAGEAIIKYFGDNVSTIVMSLQDYLV